MIKVSIIVPVYNSEEYLSTCLDSLVNQTLDDIEIITIDDNSTDNSLKILLDYAKKYKNIKVYHNEKNLGQGATRNRGIELATGDYIGFVDSDDYVNRSMYQDMYTAARSNNYPELVTTNLIFVKDNSYAKNDLTFLKRNEEIVIKPSLNKDSILFESPSVCNKIFRKDTIKNYKFLDNCMFEDILFTYTKYMEASKVVSIPSINYFYRRDITRGVSSLNYEINDHISDIFRVLDKLKSDLDLCGRYEMFESEIKILQLSYALIRVDEINNWQLDDDEKEKLKRKMFSLIKDKYGDLENVDFPFLECKCGFSIVGEYANYLESLKNRNVNIFIKNN